MRRKYLLYFVVLAGLCLLLAGCGGPQNPLQFDAVSTAFFNGLWDGVTILIAFVMELVINHHKYGIYDVHQHSLAYDVGFMLGAGGFLFGGFSVLD